MSEGRSPNTNLKLSRNIESNFHNPTDSELPESFAAVINYSFPLRFPKPLQDGAITLMLKGSDLLIEVENGRGVEVFGPAVVEIVYREMNRHYLRSKYQFYRRPFHNRQPRAIIVEPTKESAEKAFDVIQRFVNLVTDPDLHLQLAVDGVDMEKLKESFRSKGVDILVGTPSELQHLQTEGSLKVNMKCRCFVVDEACRILTGASREVVESLQPAKAREGWVNTAMRSTVVCSSILEPSEIQEFAQKRMITPTHIRLIGKDALPETAFHAVVRIDPTKDSSWRKIDRQIVTDGVHSQDDFDAEKLDNNTLSEAIKILRGEYIVRAIDAHNMDKAVIICRTRMDCDNLEEYLKYLDEEKYSCACYSAIEGDNESGAIDVAQFEDIWLFKFLICTEQDLRQVRLTGLPFLINASCPSDGQDYLRRVEKIGSSERLGLVINLVAAVPEKVWHHGEWCPSKGADCWNTESWENKGCCVWQNELEDFIRIKNELDMKFHEIEPDLKVPFIEVDGQRYYVNQRQLEEHLLPIMEGGNQKCNGKDQQILPKESSVDPVVHLCCTSERSANKRSRPDAYELPHAVEGTGQKYNGDEQPQQQLRKNGTEGPGGENSSSCTPEGSASKRFRPNDDSLLHVVEVDGQKCNGHDEQQQPRKEGIGGPGGKHSSTCSPEGSANKRFRPNDDVTISSTSDEVLTTGHAAVITSIRVAICHRGYPSSELTKKQLITLQRSIMKAVELVPDDGPQVRFQECVQKFGWLLVVCADVESCSWLWNTVNYMKPWEGAQLRVVLEKDLLPQTPVWEAFVPDDSKIRLTSEEVLTRLKKMNRALDTNKWKVLSNKESKHGQYWTFRIDMKSMKELESMDCRPFCGFGRVQFECKSKIEYPKSIRGPAIAHTARDRTAVAQPVEDATSAAKPMEEKSSKEDNLHMVELVEPLKSGSSASEPKESDNSAERLNSHRAITEQLPKSDTSVTKPIEDDTPVAEPINNKPSQEESAHMAESKENESSAMETLESCISATESKESDNSATKPLSSGTSVVEPLEGDTSVTKLIDDDSLATKSLVTDSSATEQLKSGIPLTRAIQGDTSVAEPQANNASKEESSHGSESTRDESSAMEPLGSNISKIEPKESDNAATKSLKSETPVVKQPITVDTPVQKLIETKSLTAEPPDSGHVSTEQSKCDTSVTKPIEDDTSVAEAVEENTSKEESAQVSGSIEDGSCAREPLESGTSTTEPKEGVNSSTEPLKSQTSIVSDTAEEKLKDGTFVAKPLKDTASKEESTHVAKTTEVESSAVGPLESGISTTSVVEPMDVVSSVAELIEKESSAALDGGSAVTEQSESGTSVTKPIQVNISGVEPMADNDSNEDSSHVADSIKEDSSLTEPLESSTAATKPKEDESSVVEPMESDNPVAKSIENEVFAVEPSNSDRSVTENVTNYASVRKPLEDAAFITVPMESINTHSVAKEDQSSAIELIESGAPPTEPRKSVNSTTRPIKSETSVLEPMQAVTSISQLIEKESFAAKPLDGGRAVTEQLKSRISVTKQIEGHISVEELKADDASNENSAHAAESVEDESSAKKPLDSGFSAIEPEESSSSAGKLIESETSVVEQIASDTSAAELIADESSAARPSDSGRSVAEPMQGSASKEESTCVAKTVEDESSTIIVRLDIETSTVEPGETCDSATKTSKSETPVTEPMESDTYVAEIIEEESSAVETFDTGRSVTEQLKNDICLKKPILEHDTSVAKLMGDSVSNEESMNVDDEKSAIEPLETNVSAPKPKGNDKSATKPLESKISDDGLSAKEHSAKTKPKESDNFATEALERENSAVERMESGTSATEPMKDNASKQDSTLVTESVEDSSAVEPSKSGTFATEPSEIGIFVTESPKTGTSSTQQKTGDIYVCRINRSWY